MPTRRTVIEPLAVAAAPRAAAPAALTHRPQPQPQPAPAPANFADHRVSQAIDDDHAELFAEPAAAVPVPQPTQPRRSGDPSPEALARLQRAVQNVPKAAPMAGSADARARDSDKGSRMTINSLIHRMTGQVGREETPLRPRAADPLPGRATAQPAEPYEDTDRERVDIPAFLRRQAN